MKKLIILLLSLCALNSLAAPVNVNSADAKTIADALSGIGQKKAEAIVKYREEHGPFKTPEDLLEIAGIGEKTLENIKPDLLFDNQTTTADNKKADKQK
jgi:competence protein ComEA